jgi:hypothetical protein
LVLAGHDYGVIKNTWTLPMVLRANEALDLKEELESKIEALKYQAQNKGLFGG